MMYHFGIIDIYFRSKTAFLCCCFFSQLYNLYNNLVLLLHFPLGYLQMDSIKIIVWYIIDSDSFIDVISISWLCFLLFHQFFLTKMYSMEPSIIYVFVCVDDWESLEYHAFIYLIHCTFRIYPTRRILLFFLIITNCIFRFHRFIYIYITQSILFQDFIGSFSIWLFYACSLVVLSIGKTNLSDLTPSH